MASIDVEIKTNFTDDRHRFIANMMFTANMIQNKFTVFLKPYGISSPQFNILRILRGNGDWVSMNDIKGLMIEKSPNATRLADKLLDKGFIERRRLEEDKRVVLLKVTEAGLELLSAIDKADGDVIKPLFNNITKEEARLVSDIIDKFRG